MFQFYKIKNSETLCFAANLLITFKNESIATFGLCSYFDIYAFDDWYWYISREIYK